MSVNYRNGLKTWVLKYMALLIGLCYLANPCHQVIYTVFHEVSHIISPPDVTVSATKINQKEKQNLNHEHDHLRAHNHNALNRIAALINPSDGLDLDNKNLLNTYLIDKHISTNILTLSKILPTVIQNNDDNPINKVIVGFLEIIELPPRLV
ncbi:hypothetical protein ES711_14145 [Gelidibacter salicanalis]|uniref:Uncharacterized protein n=1 Tax=Gelidibacter salicanalis TaxID=291193 RepID=A0A5C7ADK4_9FLAO|nr:hypothetical protein [Gelidibacter salicanalis]TXE05974.1 hypothetical protein ES711_14145 [Gelidibacter salicanalis]